jgi:protein ImuB
MREQASWAPRSGLTPPDPRAPLVLSVPASGGPRIVALNEAAERAGLALGDRTADARARVNDLQIHLADPQADDAALRRLALWSTRYTPAVALWGEAEGADGLFLDVTGATHLFGGETPLLADLAERLRRFGLPARLALAGTYGASWACARFGRTSITPVPAGQETEALRDLPIEALRLPEPVRIRLRRLGFKRIRDVMGQPRAPLATRFGEILMRRLDQALGHTPESVPLFAEPPVYRATRQLLEPIGTQDAIVMVATQLMEDLRPSLERDGVGARSLHLGLHRVDGEVVGIGIEVAIPTRDPIHVGRLTRLKLDHLGATVDAGHGFEALHLHVLVAEPVRADQLVLSPSAESERSERLATLMDVLRQRFGTRSVRRLWLRESHIPERAVSVRLDEDGPPVWPQASDPPPRPVLLLVPAEPAETLALGPDASPLRFRWRGLLHDVAHAEGPERIAPEWWRRRVGDLTRDYYVVEDRTGRRFWMFREGLPDQEPVEPRWFVHGLFA